MKTTQLRDEVEYMLVQYIMKTSTNRSIDYIVERLNELKKQFVSLSNV